MSARIHTSLQKLVAIAPSDEAQLRRMAAAAWHQTGSLMVFHFQKGGWADRELIEQIGGKLYGPRMGG